VTRQRRRKLGSLWATGVFCTRQYTWRAVMDVVGGHASRQQAMRNSGSHASWRAHLGNKRHLLLAGVGYRWRAVTMRNLSQTSVGLAFTLHLPPTSRGRERKHSSLSACLRRREKGGRKRKGRTREEDIFPIWGRGWKGGSYAQQSRRSAVSAGWCPYLYLCSVAFHCLLCWHTATKALQGATSALPHLFALCLPLYVTRT